MFQHELARYTNGNGIGRGHKRKIGDFQSCLHGLLSLPHSLTSVITSAKHDVRKAHHNTNTVRGVLTADWMTTIIAPTILCSICAGKKEERSHTHNTRTLSERTQTIFLLFIYCYFCLGVKLETNNKTDNNKNWATITIECNKWSHSSRFFPLDIENITASAMHPITQQCEPNHLVRL